MLLLFHRRYLPAPTRPIWPIPILPAPTVLFRNARFWTEGRIGRACRWPVGLPRGAVKKALTPTAVLLNPVWLNSAA